MGRGLSGVIYPSVRVNGEGFNVAISPGVVDKKLKIVAAAECSMYKLFENTIVDNDFNIENIIDENSFSYYPVNPLYHAGQAECLRRLGVSHITDLI